MKDLNFELSKLCRRNRDGSISTRRQRYSRLQVFADQLHDLGFRNMYITSLKHKHVVALVSYWQKNGLSAATIHNYMTAIRWWAEKVGRSRVMLPSNGDYGIPPRDFTLHNRAQTLSEQDFLRIKDDYVRMSVRLQQAFGLRREESIKFRPNYADHGDSIHLKGSWTKGGRPREIPIVEAHQRELLIHISHVVGTGSLIPDHLMFKHQLGRYVNAVAKADLNNLHGLRHGYAQRRYQFLAGWPSPAAGGPKHNELTQIEREIDERVRLHVSRELGHNRIEITAVYLGK